MKIEKRYLTKSSVSHLPPPSHPWIPSPSTHPFLPPFKKTSMSKNPEVRIQLFIRMTTLVISDVRVKGKRENKEKTLKWPHVFALGGGLIMGAKVAISPQLVLLPLPLSYNHHNHHLSRHLLEPYSVLVTICSKSL